MVSAAGLFLGLAIITLIGFFSSLLAKRGRFPDLLVLVFLGMLLGPINAHVLGWETLSRVVGAIPFEVITPVFGALALAVIMFDAGLNLHVEELTGGLRKALGHTVLVYALTVAAVAACAHLLMGFPVLVGVLFGAILGGISTAVVVSVSRSMPLRPETRTMITLECILVDVLAIATAVAVMEALKGGALDGGKVAQAVVQNLAVALMVGLALGIAFTFSLPRLRGAANLYVLSLGALLGTYAIIELLGGSGPMGVLAFGVVLGNSRNPLFGGRDLAPEMSDEINHFHRQTSFLVRTFFFVLLGLTFSLGVFQHADAVATGLPWLSQWNGTWPLVLAGVVGVYAAILLPRVLTARVTTHPEDRRVVSLMVGRGLGSAVLATFPFTIAEFAVAGSPYERAMAPYREIFPTLASLLVILTVVTTALGAAFAAPRKAASRTLTPEGPAEAADAADGPALSPPPT